MKLRIIQKILTDNIPKLKFEGVNIPSTTPPRYHVKNMILVRKAIDEIATINLFKREIDIFKTSTIYAYMIDEIDMIGDEYHRLADAQSKLREQGNNMLQGLNSILPQENETTISIKLPDINDFDDLVQVLLDFEKIIKYPILNPIIKGSIKIETFETGSLWIDIFLGTQAAIYLIAGLSWAGAVIYKKIQEGKMFEQFARGIKIKNDSLEDIKEAQKRTIDMMIDAEANNLYLKHFKNVQVQKEQKNEDIEAKQSGTTNVISQENNNTGLEDVINKTKIDDKQTQEIGNAEIDNEQIERLKMSIRTFSNLIERGAEIHPALQVPETVSNLYPNYKQLETISSKIKQIEK